MNARSLPEDIRKQVDQIVERFNQTQIQDPDCYYVPRYRGLYLYLDRWDYGQPGSVCRLKYTGNLGKWEFAIFKYSDERYDPHEWLFPGSEFVDGTLEGAMKAGLEAYPP